MHSLKSFLEPRVKKVAVTTPVKAIVNETTIEPHHEDRADNWDHHGDVSDETSNKIHTAFGGKDFTHFPLVGHSSVDPDVGEHLANHGYDIKDYRKGIVSKKTIVGNPAKGIPHREKVVEEKIGSVLDKTKASDSVKKAYVNDPARTAFKSSMISGGHHVVISTHPYAIAGASTGTNWNSCMNMDDGCNRDYLQHDSRTGTHVAYLVHHDDPTAFKTGLPTKPLARVMLKAHHDSHDSNDGERDTIYRPEHRSYGSSSDSFNHAVNAWASTHYPAKSDTTYHKDDSLYNDDGVNTYRAITPKHIEKNLKSGLSIYHDMGREKPSLDHDSTFHAVHIASEMIKHPETNPIMKQKVLSHVLEVPNLNSQHIAKIRHATNQHDFGDFDANHQIATMHGDKLSSAAIHEQYGANPDKPIPNKVLMNSKLPDSIVDSVSPSKYNNIHRSKLKEHHYDKVVDANIEHGVTIQSHADYLSPKHLSKLITGNKYAEKETGSNLRAGYTNIPFRTITAAKNFGQEHHEQLLDANAKQLGNIDLLNHVLGQSKFASSKDFDKIGSTDKMHSYMMQNPNISGSTGMYLKNKFIDKVKSLPEPTEHGSMLEQHKSNGYKDRFNIGDYSGPMKSNQPHIPETISKHMSDSDYSEIAKKGKVPSFADPSHSAKLLDAYHKQAKVHDTIMDEHIAHKTKEADDNGEEYYEEDDPSAAPKRAAYHAHMARYGSALYDHLQEHAGGREGYIKNYRAHDAVGKHIGNIDDLEHYKTENNSSRHDDIDHWAEHFGDTAEEHHKLPDHTDEY